MIVSVSIWRRSGLGLIGAMLLSLFIVLPATARDVTEAEQAALAETVSAFDAAMRVNDMAKLLDILPPKMLAGMAEQHGITIEQLRAVSIEQTAKVMASITIVSFSMDVAGARHEELADGTPYVMIPSETLMDMGDGKVRAKAETLAILDEGKWYLLRVDSSHIPLLHKVYPAFSDVAFSDSTLEPVEE